jgi:hypothetical protein
MAIPEVQLEAWAKQGTTATASQTYNYIRTALGRIAWPAGHEPDIYLQGSYRNGTNIDSGSDVDIVVEFASIFQSNLKAPAAEHPVAYKAPASNAGFSWSNAHAETLKGLIDYCGSSAVNVRKRVIQVITPNRMADVLVAIQFRKHSRLVSLFDQEHIPGIQSEVPSDGSKISNFPQLHYDNGVAKQKRTNGMYKPMVRLLKNANRCAVDIGLLADGVASSYGINCLVYSAPDALFGDGYQNTFVNVVNWAESNVGAIRRVSEQGVLVGDGVNLWKKESAQEYILALARLWNNWS